MQSSFVFVWSWSGCWLESMRPFTPSTQQPAGDHPVGIPERELVVELDIVVLDDVLVEDVLAL
jgi:hypothetical protein